MWWVFPQLCVAGGTSSTTAHYCLQTVGQAVAYARHGDLSWQYFQALRAVEAYLQRGNKARDLFSDDDVKKLASSLTLFENVFQRLGRIDVGRAGNTAADVADTAKWILDHIRVSDGVGRCFKTQRALLAF